MPRDGARTRSGRCAARPGRSRSRLAIDAGNLWPKVADAIEALPDEERDALVLFVWEELGYEEIAAALGVPVGTVRSRLNRARGRLRELRSRIGREQ